MRSPKTTGLPSLAELSRLIRERLLSPAGIVERCLQRIAERDGVVQAWARVAADEARHEANRLARELEQAPPLGPLHGVPVGVKDIFDTAGIPTEWGSPLYAGRVPSQDSALVRQLKLAGAIVLGKTHTTAFAYFDPGPTRNPCQLGHTPGGSSSGSAAAVADGMVPIALGSQTLGSVLRPASFCGVVGLKPTYGQLPLAGTLPFAPTLDHAGFFSRTVDDMMLLWSIFEHDGSRTPETPRSLAVPPWPLAGGLEPEMEEAFGGCLERLRQAGFSVEPITLPESFRNLPKATHTVLTYEASQVHRQRFGQFGQGIGEKLAALVENGLRIEQADYLAAMEILRAARADFSGLAAQHPIVATPAALGPAPAGLESTGDPASNAPFTALGAPALSLPFGRTPAGLPLGLQLAAGPGEEQRLLSAALACERALGN